MCPETAIRRRENRLEKAVDMIEGGKKVREADVYNGVPKSTDFDRLVARRKNNGPVSCTAFPRAEEERIVYFVVH